MVLVIHSNSKYRTNNFPDGQTEKPKKEVKYVETGATQSKHFRNKKN